MQVTQTKEDISISYISALCAYAGIAYEIIRHDDDSTDGILMKRIYLDTGHRFDAQLRIQLKCTSSATQHSDTGKQIRKALTTCTKVSGTEEGSRFGKFLGDR